MPQSGPLICLDVDYRSDHAVAAAVAFNDWGDEFSVEDQTAMTSPVEDYVPGQFYRRELPCLLAVLQKLTQPPRLVVVDSYVLLSGKSPGLGAYLYEALNRSVPVIGVAKTRFHSAPATEVLRGGSHSPLFVTAIGIDLQVAATSIQQMHGPYRIPTLLKRVDQLCRAEHVGPVPESPQEPTSSTSRLV